MVGQPPFHTMVTVCAALSGRPPAASRASTGFSARSRQRGRLDATQAVTVVRKAG